MKFWFWRLRLGLWCWRYQYAGCWWQPFRNISYAMQRDCWEDMFDDGWPPLDALHEDASSA
jgi:hypothetical protein